LARRNDATLVPFLLEGVAADPELNLPDGIHPNLRGHRIMAGTVWHALEPIVEDPGE
ncbi:MAG: arylesterase, partial [Gammaproteobacteria bacterium]|nr:arylesterase [Gemmatimonadota bacterium]NIU78108.1 arylesterase [Gammaproteobacteria bacterium]NIV89435.1 arylesterase [Actinomycetota bacterium]NIX23727.1 arylesterase [Actinomycetota bacterium]